MYSPQVTHRSASPHELRSNHSSLENSGKDLKTEQSMNCPTLSQANSLSATLVWFVSRVLIERNFFQNTHVPAETLIYLANDLIKLLNPKKEEEVLNLGKEVSLLWKQFRKSSLTKEEQDYLDRPQVLDVPGEILNGLKYSSMALMGQSLYSSVASAVKGKLWSHIPAICGYFSVAMVGPQAIASTVDKILQNAHLTPEQKSLVEPWLNVVGRLALGFVPKVHATQQSVYYHYPSQEGHYQTASLHQTTTLKGTTFSLARTGELETPEGSFEGVYETEFTLGKIDELSQERIQIKITHKNGYELPVEFTRVIGDYGPEIIVTCEDKDLEQHWAQYFHPKQQSSPLPTLDTAAEKVALYDGLSSKSGLALNIPEANIQRSLQQPITLHADKDELESRLAQGNVFLTSMIAGALGVLTKINQATSFPGAAAAPANIITQYRKYADMIGDANQIKDTVFRILEDKTKVDLDTPENRALDFFIGVITTTANSAKFYADLVQDQLEQIAIQKIKKVEEAMELYKRQATIEYAKNEIKEAKLWLPKAAEALNIAVAEEAKAEANYQKCLVELEKDRTTYSKLAAHANDLTKLFEMNNHWAKRLKIGRDVKDSFDFAVEGPITDERLNNGPAHIKQAYNDAKNMIAEAEQNMQEIATAMKKMYEHDHAFKQSIEQWAEFIKTTEASCNRARDSKLGLIQARLNLINIRDKKLEDIELYEQYLKLNVPTYNNNKDEL